MSAARDEKLPRMLIFAEFNEHEEQVTSAIGVDGKEYPSAEPMELPIGYSASPTLQDMIKRMVQSQLLAVAADAEGFESFEESEDFEVEDDEIDVLTPYEKVFEPPSAGERLRAPSEGAGGTAGGGVQGEAPPAPASSTATPVDSGASAEKKS